MASSDIFIGAKINELTVLDIYKSEKSCRYMTKCLCSCGVVIDIEKSNLSSGNTKRCKECSNISRSKKHMKHGCSEASKRLDPIGYMCYTRWSAMKGRCYRESDSHYKNYGGRGIEVCDRWLNSYENFIEDMGRPPSVKHQIDRTNNDGNYEPSNCKWVTRKQNANNKTNNKIITAFGESMTQSQWAEKTGIKRETISMRLRRGWSVELALSKK